MNKLFEISDYKETHRQICILGLKIKFPKKEYLNKFQSYPFESYKKNNIDITTLPPATGQIRNVQLANLALLKELDYVCRLNNLQYWLDFGSLLGAIRHKGFIPWDDDIDVSMMRDDYDKIIDAFKKSSRNPDIYAEQTLLGKSQTMIKVKHRKCPYLFVDIFPHDWANKISTKENRIKETKKMIDIRKKLSNMKNLDSSEKILDKVYEFNKEMIPDNFVENSDIQCGLEYFYTEPVWIYPHDVIFPIKEIDFEGFKAMGVNKPEEYLTDIFGDYMAYPKKFGFGHSAYVKLSETEKEVMKDLIGGY